MILKVKAANPSAIESWRYIEDVQGLHHSLYPCEEAVPADMVCSSVQYLRFMNGAESLARVAEFCFTTPTMGDVQLLCNTEAYLLNDQGKTVERLI